MPPTNSLNMPNAKLAHKKQAIVYKRILWLLGATLLAYATAHAALLAGLDPNGQDTKERSSLLEMISVALLPLLLLVGYGARTYKWGLWCLASILLVLTIFNGWLA